MRPSLVTHPAVVAEELVRPARLDSSSRCRSRRPPRPAGSSGSTVGVAVGAVALVARLEADAAEDLALDGEVPLRRGAERVVRDHAAEAGDLRAATRSCAGFWSVNGSGTVAYVGFWLVSQGFEMTPLRASAAAPVNGGLRRKYVS